MIRRRFRNLNSGVMSVYVETDGRFAPGIDPKSEIGLDSSCVLAYESKSCREQDVELANAEGFRLTRKVRVRKNPYIASESICGILGRLYTVKYVDDDGSGSYYAFLESIETDGTIEMLASGGRDEIGNRIRDYHAIATVHALEFRLKSSFDKKDSTSYPMATAFAKVRACDVVDGTVAIRRNGIVYELSAVKPMGAYAEITAVGRH